MTQRVRIAVATIAIRRYPDFAAFERHMEALAAEAKADSVDLLLLPELTCLGLLWTETQAGNTGIPVLAAFYDAVLTPLYDRYVECFSGLALRHGLTIAGASFWHRKEGKACNSGFVFSPAGDVLRQDKLHPTRPERAIDTIGGDRLACFTVADVRMGLAICYDIQFPEVSRALADAGAEVILVPSLTDERGLWRVRHCAHARAIENQCYVCVSPLVGDLGIPREKPVHGRGSAFIACPIDNRFGATDGTFAKATDESESLLIADLDMDLLRLSRSKAEIMPLSDRRDALYAGLKARIPTT